MKFPRLAASAAAIAMLGGTCGIVAAQTSSTPSAPVPHHSHATEPAPGQTVFSRSLQSPGKKAKASQPQPNVPRATKQQLRALTVAGYNLDIHLTPRSQSLSVDANLTVRNNGATPLHEIALQLSSSLHFQGIGTAGKQLVYAQHTVASDADHTGKLTQADILLPTPLAPGSTMPIQVFYGGRIVVSAQRLQSIGAPRTVAKASDWDRISENFTGLRGFGNVVWYPVSSVPVTMGDGNRLFEEIGRQKERDTHATVTMKVTVEYFHHPPNLAILDGRIVPVGKPVSLPTLDFPGVISFTLPKQPIGFQQLSLVVARRQLTQKDHVEIFARPADSQYTSSYLKAAAKVEPMVEQWLGPKPASPLAVVDLPESDDEPSQLGAALLTPLSATPPAGLSITLVHALAHAWFRSPRGWLQEGVPSFLVTLWIEHTKGRQAALEYLENERGALAIAEPSSPGSSRGEPLVSAWDPVYVRTKSAYVFWMLRHLAGDSAIQSALQHYVPQKDTTPDYFEGLLAHASGKTLHWFFQDWVYQDPGLPDLSVTSVYPHKVGMGETLVSITVSNQGFASAVVPVTLVSTSTKITKYLRIPANSSITHRMEITGTPTQVRVNDGTVPEVGASIHVVTLKQK